MNSFLLLPSLLVFLIAKVKGQYEGNLVPYYNKDGQRDPSLDRDYTWFLDSLKSPKSNADSDDDIGRGKRSFEDVEQEPLDLIEKATTEAWILREWGAKNQPMGKPLKIPSLTDFIKVDKQTQTEDVKNADKKIHEINRELDEMKSVGHDNQGNKKQLVPADQKNTASFEVVREPEKIVLDGNDNENLNLNINDVNVEETFVGLNFGEKDKKGVPPPPPPPPVPAPSPFRTPDYFPTSISQYYYLNMNLTDSILFLGFCTLLVFVVQKTYIWIKKTPTVPAPPVYTPNTVA